MRDRYRVLVFGILTLTALMEIKGNVSAKESMPKKEDSSSQKSAQWREKMQDLYKILTEITTDTISDRRFNAPENRTRIEKNAKKLADRAHEMTKKGASPDADPTVQILSDLFQDETKRAYWALKSGDRSYARSILSQISSYCITCHTRNGSGPSFSTLPLEPAAKNLNPIEEGRFYAATRQYDKALEVYQKIASDISASNERSFEWEQAIRYGLAIAVRVKKDPDQALALVDRVIGTKSSRFSLKQDAIKWKDSILKWKEELPRRALTEEGLRAEAVQLIAQAKELQKYPLDHSADVVYLRATAVVHELLQKAPNGRYAQDALLMAGMCYDVLRSLNLEDMHEIYYEACIKKVPHTATAESCYQRYEQSTYDGYTGTAYKESGGVRIPEDVKKKLHQLESLAHPETEQKLN